LDKRPSTAKIHFVMKQDPGSVPRTAWSGDMSSVTASAMNKMRKRRVTVVGRWWRIRAWSQGNGVKQRGEAASIRCNKRRSEAASPTKMLPTRGQRNLNNAENLVKTPNDTHRRWELFFASAAGRNHPPPWDLTLSFHIQLTSNRTTLEEARQHGLPPSRAASKLKRQREGWVTARLLRTRTSARCCTRPKETPAAQDQVATITSKTYFAVS